MNQVDYDLLVNPQMLKLYRLDSLLNAVKKECKVGDYPTITGVTHEELLRNDKRMVTNVLNEIQNKEAFLDKEDMAELNRTWKYYRRILDTSRKSKTQKAI
jgi:hypothetical protein